MERLTAVDVRKRLPEAVRRVEIAGDRYILTVNGKDRAAIVSLEDLALLERLEDEQDIREADAALAAIERGDEVPLTLEELDAELSHV
jgi:prevent-host-death family protein